MGKSALRDPPRCHQAGILLQKWLSGDISHCDHYQALVCQGEVALIAAYPAAAHTLSMGSRLRWLAGPSNCT